MSPPVRSPRVVVLFLATTLLWSACRQREETTLQALAADALAPEPDVAPAPDAPPLLVLSVNRPDRFLQRVTPLLPVLFDATVARAQADRLAPFLNIAAMYAEVARIEAAIDPATGQPRLQRFDAALLVRPAAGTRAEDLVAPWTQRLAALAAEMVDIDCAPREQMLRCRVTAGETAAADPLPSTFQQRARDALHGPDGGRVTVQLHLPGLLASLEAFVTTTLLWAVVPEEARHLDFLRLDLSEDPDRLQLSLSGHDSAALDAFAALFPRSARPVALPPGVSLVAFTTIENVEQRLEHLQDHWDNKIPVPKKYRVGAFLNDSWQNQMLELASGTVGIALVGDVDLSAVKLSDLLDLDGLVFILQPADAQMLQNRLEHVFRGKYFKLQEEALESGEVITRAMRRRGRQNTTERLAWVSRDSTWFFGTSKTLRKMLQGLDAADADARRSLRLDDAAGERGRVVLSLPDLAQQLRFSKSAGIAAGMGLGIFKNAVADLREPLRLRLVTRSAADGARAVVVEVDSVLATWDQLLKALEPFLKYLPEKSS